MKVKINKLVVLEEFFNFSKNSSEFDHEYTITDPKVMAKVLKQREALENDLVKNGITPKNVAKYVRNHIDNKKIQYGLITVTGEEPEEHTINSQKALKILEKHYQEIMDNYKNNPDHYDLEMGKLFVPARMEDEHNEENPDEFQYFDWSKHKVKHPK